ncbi:hypothetical protein [Gulosibacter macacae]|uniref:hypothetical protein n=1 Tax=Gulosibacter macacae TaxID=2488791 RepID=UPI0016397810|nr:hypothetical protein [Gulosibacter macacae]
MTGIMSALGTKSHQLPKPVEPPKPDWKVEAQERDRRAQAKAERWLARQKK